jgi:hypothetical protein
VDTPPEEIPDDPSECAAGEQQRGFTTPGATSNGSKYSFMEHIETPLSPLIWYKAVRIARKIDLVQGTVMQDQQVHAFTSMNSGGKHWNIAIVTPVQRGRKIGPASTPMPVSISWLDPASMDTTRCKKYTLPPDVFAYMNGATLINRPRINPFVDAILKPIAKDAPLVPSTGGRTTAKRQIELKTAQSEDGGDCHSDTDEDKVLEVKPSQKSAAAPKKARGSTNINSEPLAGGKAATTTARDPIEFLTFAVNTQYLDCYSTIQNLSSIHVGEIDRTEQR